MSGEDAVVKPGDKVVVTGYGDMGDATVVTVKGETPLA